jgi:hypothetical protein
MRHYNNRDAICGKNTGSKLATTATAATTAAETLVEVECRIGTPTQATYLLLLQALIAADRSSDAQLVAELAHSMPWYNNEAATIRSLLQQSVKSVDNQSAATVVESM